MASIREHVGKRATTYGVLFVQEGKQRSITFDTRKAAEKFRALVDALGPAEAIEVGLTKQTTGPTVDALFREWLAIKEQEMTTEGHKDYVRSYEKWIEPTFGSRDAELVTERDVQAWVDNKLRPNLAPKTVAKRHALLHGMYEWASSKSVGRIINDPCTETRLPKRRKSSARGLSIPELHQMLRAGEEAGHAETAAVIAVMAGTGWRPGEVMGLTAGAVDVLPNGVVYATMESVYRRSEGIVDGGKTDAAGRRVRVLGPGAKTLAERVVGLGVRDLVFPHPSPGRGHGHATDEHGRPLRKPWPPSSFGRHYWGKVVEAAGLGDRKPTPYWLRHTHVAMCHAAGLTLPEIQRRIGHESIQTTIDVYGRMIDGMSDEAATRLDALLTPAPVELAASAVVVGEVTEGA